MAPSTWKSPASPRPRDGMPLGRARSPRPQPRRDPASFMDCRPASARPQGARIEQPLHEPSKPRRGKAASASGLTAACYAAPAMPMVGRGTQMTKRQFTPVARSAQPRARGHKPARLGARDAILVHVTLLVLLLCRVPAAAQNLALEPVADGLTAPLQLEEPGDGSGRKFIVQQDGVVRVLGPDGRLAPEPFLDLRPRMLPLEQNFEERGLLGFALHPQFARNGRLFVTYAAPLRPGAPERWNYTRRVSEFTADPGNPAKIDAASERVLFELDWPSRKHNGGGLAFGPDGFLYIGLGDGGISHGFGKQVQWEAFEIPAQALIWDGLAQDTDSLFGKILRIDVDRGFPS